MATRAKGQNQFRREGSLFIAELSVNHFQSMKLLADNDLRPLTYREAFAHATELIEKLQGKWFYLDGKGIADSGLYVFGVNGKFITPTGCKAQDRTVNIYSGDRPLSIIVSSDRDAEESGWRFELIADVEPSHASVVVGINDSLMEAEKNVEMARGALERLKRDMPERSGHKEDNA